MRLVKAAVVVALGLTLLVPTFNALNASYATDVPPPPWLPTPPTPPDITPPTDFKPPSGMTPPTNYKGKVPPGGACPPPLVRAIPIENDTITSNGSRWSAEHGFDIPNGSIGFKGFMNWSWRASHIYASITGPGGFKKWENQTDADPRTGTLIVSPTTRTITYVYDSYQETGQTAKPGHYTLYVSADLPIDGTVTYAFGVALACGGLLSS